MEIVKVQLSIIPPEAVVMIYNQERSWGDLMLPEDLPPKVLAAARPTGKAYFFVEETDEEIKFCDQAPAQGW